MITENKKQKQIGRKPKDNPAVFRYSISFNAEENAKFLSLFDASGMKVKAHFITACIFKKPIFGSQNRQGNNGLLYAPDYFSFTISGNRRQL